MILGSISAFCAPFAHWGTRAPQFWGRQFEGPGHAGMSGPGRDRLKHQGAPECQHQGGPIWGTRARRNVRTRARQVEAPGRTRMSAPGRANLRDQGAPGWTTRTLKHQGAPGLKHQGAPGWSTGAWGTKKEREVLAYSSFIEAWVLTMAPTCVGGS